MGLDILPSGQLLLKLSLTAENRRDIPFDCEDFGSRTKISVKLCDVKEPAPVAALNVSEPLSVENQEDSNRESDIRGHLSPAQEVDFEPEHLDVSKEAEELKKSNSDASME
jgi:hypothetical protein